MLEEVIDAGFDILNPVQCSAVGMDPLALKKDFGDRIVFWGGGVDTQRTLPFGTPEEVRREVRDRIDALAPGGGFVFGKGCRPQAAGRRRKETGAVGSFSIRSTTYKRGPR